MQRHLRLLPLFASLFAMLTLAAPGYGSLGTPVGSNTVVGVPVPAFHWTAVSGANHYIFELDSGSTIGTPIATITTNNTEATLNQTIADGPYTWRVRAVDASSNNGPWSTPVNWTKAGAAPVLTSPANGTTVTYPTPVVLKWSPVEGAFNYTVSMSTSSNMSNPTTDTTEGTNYAPSAWLAPGAHYWTITAKDARGNPVGTSSVYSFNWSWPSTVGNLNVTNAVDASAGATARWTMFDPQFTWDPVSGAVKYQVEVNTDDVTWSAASKVCCSDTIATTLTPKSLLPNATYSWRVRAVDASGAVGAWTVGPTFTQSFDSFVTAPTPTTPSIANMRMVDNVGDPGTDVDGGTAGYQTQVPVVKWDAVPGASGYDVLMVQYVSGQCQWTTSGVPRWTARTAATAFTPLGYGWNNLAPWPNNGVGVSTDNNDLTDGMSYCVRVTPFRDTATNGSSGVDVSGDPTFLDPNDDGTAPAFQFTTLPTGNPCSPSCTNGYMGSGDYLAPITGSTTGAVPLFTWKPVAGASSYFVIVARDQAFNTIVDYAFTHIPAYAPRSGSPRTYQNQSTHYWWVVLPATGPDGSGAATIPNFSHPQSFDRPQVGPSLVAPADSATVSGNPTFSWDPIDGARQYELLITTDPNLGVSGKIEDIITSNTSYTPFDKGYPSDDLYWAVRALDYNGNPQPWSVTRVYHQTWPTPDLTGVSNPTASDVVPAFQWQPVTGAISYSVQVDQPGNGTANFNNLTTTVLTPTSAYGLGDFKWRVQANFGGSGGTTGGPMTSDQIFTRSIHAPTGLATIAPSGTSKSPVLFSWDWKDGAKGYNIQVSRDPSFASSVESGSTDTTSWASLMQAMDYNNGGSFYWRVQATDSHGTGGTWSSAQPLVFATRLVATTGTSVMPVKSTQTIKITVKDALGHNVRGAKVTISGAGVKKASKTTASNGTVSFKAHPTKKGKITFSASKSGCAGSKVTTVVY